MSKDNSYNLSKIKYKIKWYKFNNYKKKYKIWKVFYSHKINKNANVINFKWYGIQINVLTQ